MESSRRCRWGSGDAGMVRDWWRIRLRMQAADGAGLCHRTHRRLDECGR